MDHAEKSSTTQRIDSLKSVPSDNIRRLHAYASELRNTVFLEPRGEPNPEWRLFFGKDPEEAFENARRAAETAGGGQTNTIMNHGLAKMRSAAEKSNRVSELQDVRKVFGDMLFNMIDIDPKIIAIDAAIDASSHAELIAADDLDFNDKEKILEHSHKRKEVWQRGYGLCAEAGGALYVFKVQEQLSKPVDLREGTHRKLPGIELETLIRQEELVLV